VVARARPARRGAEGLAFPVIVASGPNAALPYHHPGDREIGAGETLIADAGALADGYCADCTRTFATGPLPDEPRRAYDVCRSTQESSLAAVRPGATGVDLDAVARSEIELAGIAPVLHGLGHGVGLEVHELPVLRPTSTDTLVTANVVTVEPGVYLAGRGGVHIGDLVIVGGEGPEVLTSFTKDCSPSISLEKPSRRLRPAGSDGGDDYNPPVVAETVSTNQFKNGMHIELDGQVWRIVGFQHVKPGKGGAFVRTKLKSLGSGAVVDRTFRAGERMPRAHTEMKNVQYLYDSGDEVVFMDEETYEQVSLRRRDVEDELDFIRPSGSVQLLTVDGSPSGIQLPASVELTVSETEPGVRGDSVSNVTKPATLETGAVVQVPLFVNPGDRIKVDTRDRRYISRA
jgi:elongation factor P